MFHSWSAQGQIDPLPIAGALGSYFWDYDGNRYLDFSSQLVNVNIGHQHPKLVAAIQEQSGKLATVGPTFANDARSEAARLISELAPGDLNKVFFTNGGAEANENAVRMARLHTGRTKVLAACRSYHGSTAGAIALTGDPRRWSAEPAMPGVVHYWGPYAYHSAFHAENEAQECERALAHLRDTLTVEGPHTVAAIILEPVVGTNGILVPPENYLSGVRAICDEFGIMLMADKVMAGFGRCGEWFAGDRWNVTPDLITFAKGINSGYVPLGGVVISEKIAATFDKRPYPGGLTYSGHPLACASTVASINIFKKEGIVEHARTLGSDVIGPLLRELADRHPSVGEVRGLGVFWALELVVDRATRQPLVPFNASGATPPRWESLPQRAGAAVCGLLSTSTGRTWFRRAPQAPTRSGPGSRFLMRPSTSRTSTTPAVERSRASGDPMAGHQPPDQQQSRSSMTSTIEHFINGELTSGTGERTQQVFNPATGQVTGELRLANQDDVKSVVAEARNAADSWSQVSLSTRTGILFRFREQLAAHTDELATIVTSEHGKVLSDSKGEIGRGLEVAEFACGIIEQLKGEYSDQVSTGIDVYSFREPLGVVAGITPFNFPVMVPLWMAPVAIATDNAFILNPSERDPSASILMARLWQDAGLPDGVFNVLHGDKEAVDGLLEHPDVDGISFVGSTPIAQYVHQRATANGKRVQALGGAKNHAVVLADADMDLAADHLNAAAFGSAGQRRMAISVAVAVGDAADVLIGKVAERANKVTVAGGTKTDSDMGPVITPAARDRAIRIVGEAEADGAALVVDGRDLVVEGNEDGFFVGPTVIDRVRSDMSAYTEEIFGPVLLIVRVANLDEAIELINANPYGNGTAVFTASGTHARRFMRSVKVGMIGVNIPLPILVAWHSFGGWNDSLFGDLHIYGPDGVRFYTRGKVVTQRCPEPAHASDASFAFPSN